MQERHDILWETIGYLDKEQEALEMGTLIRNLSLSAILVGGVLETIFFYLYNSKLHPLAGILEDDTNQGTSYPHLGFPFKSYLDTLCNWFEGGF